MPSRRRPTGFPRGRLYQCPLAPSPEEWPPPKPDPELEEELDESELDDEWNENALERR